jgi:hypothetical protein
MALMALVDRAAVAEAPAAEAAVNEAPKKPRAPRKKKVATA